MLNHDLAVEQIPVADLRTYTGNPRSGHVEAIAASLRTNGQYRPLVVNKGTHTGKPNEVLAGNHTLMAARDLGWPTVAVTFLDVDEDQARRILLADNRTSQLGTFDNAALAELLQDAPDLEGTGYSQEDLGRLLDSEVGERKPEEFPEYDDNIETQYRCPKCSYEWSGKAS